MVIIAETIALETEEKEMMIAGAETTGKETATVGAETEITIVDAEIMTVDAGKTEKEMMIADAGQSVVNPVWIPDLLFLFQVREHADVRALRAMNKKINVREKSRTFSLTFELNHGI
ncbi:MAG: hypothetical protein ACI4ED_03245 [Suilimivivens sp.]